METAPLSTIRNLQVGIRLTNKLLDYPGRVLLSAGALLIAVTALYGKYGALFSFFFSDLAPDNAAFLVIQKESFHYKKKFLNIQDLRLRGDRKVVMLKML